MMSNNELAVLRECPYCHTGLYNQASENMTLKTVAEILENNRFTFLGNSSSSRQSQFYHCYKCRKSIVLAYEQFL